MCVTSQRRDWGGWLKAMLCLLYSQLLQRQNEISGGEFENCLKDGEEYNIVQNIFIFKNTFS